MEPRTVLASLFIAVCLGSNAAACGLRRMLHIDVAGNKRFVEEPIMINGQYVRGGCSGPQVVYVDPGTGEKIIVHEIVYDASERNSNPHPRD